MRSLQSASLIVRPPSGWSHLDPDVLEPHAQLNLDTIMWNRAGYFVRSDGLAGSSDTIGQCLSWLPRMIWACIGCHCHSCIGASLVASDVIVRRQYSDRPAITVPYWKISGSPIPHCPRGKRIFMFRIVDIDFSSCRESLENRPFLIGRESRVAEYLHQAPAVRHEHTLSAGSIASGRSPQLAISLCTSLALI